ncbi:MAG TPA: sensor histidine kinase [Blastocatellia bacterium]|nr:sensor histidine kinase [Blastocatellia bacterium]
MKYRNLMTATAAIAFICGILLAIGPPAFIPNFFFTGGEAPLEAWPPREWMAYSLVRILGGALVMIGVIAWKMRNLERVEDQRNMARALFVAGQSMLIIALAQRTALLETRGAWFFISLILLIICGSLYLLFWELRTIPLDSPAAAQNPEALRQQWIRQLSETAAQQERNRLARDLHDSIKQQIFRINVAAATAQTRWESDPEGAERAVADVRGAAREAMTEMEAMLQHLRPAPLENVGLIEALRKQCEALQYRAGATVTAEFGELPDNEIWPPGAQEAIFRIAQEGLNNIARHTRATNVRLGLHQQIDGETPVLLLTLRDDGAGFDPGQSNLGMGLANIKLRAAEIGGTVELESAPGQGASLTVRIPLSLLGLDKLERQSKINLVVGLVIIFVMGLVNLVAPYYLGLLLFLLPTAWLILPRFWVEARFLEKTRAAKNAPLNRSLTLVRSGYQRGFFFLAALAFWGINMEMTLNLPQQRWGGRGYVALRLGIPLFMYALWVVLSGIHRLTEELKEKLAPQDFRSNVKQMQAQTWNLLLAATPIIALAVMFGRGLQPLGMIASLLLYLGYLTRWRRQE